MLVKEIMQKVVAVDNDISIREAAKIMSQKDIGSLIAVKGDKILGIITEKDVTKNVSDSSKKISSIMSKQTITIEEDESLEDAAELMAKNKVKHLPVLDSDEKLVGIITSTDLIANASEIDSQFLFN